MVVGCMVFSSKRGMSPLIATVLLIAFAVAIGTMIMNWSAGVHAEGDAGDFCQAISIITDEGACYDENNQLVFTVRNNGNEQVDGLLLGSSSADSEQDIKVKDSSLVVGERLQKSIAFLYAGGPIELEFVPLVLIEEDLNECRGSGFVQTELPKCA